MEFEIQVFTEEGQVEQIKCLRFEARVFVIISAPHQKKKEATVPWSLSFPALRTTPTKLDLFPQQTKMRIVAQQTKHDEIRIQPVQAMSHVGVVIGLGTRQAYVLHDLVLAFSRDLVAGEDDGDFCPVRVFRDLFVYKVPELIGQAGHERCACVQLLVSDAEWMRLAQYLG